MRFLSPLRMLFVLLLCIVFCPKPSHAVFNEQLAITAKAISLGNAVTAEPPGIMAVHYNPAGLSLMPDGTWVNEGITIPWIQKTDKFRADPNFEGFLGGYNNDPLAGKSGTNTSGLMYLPIVDTTINFLISPALGLSYRPVGSKWTFAVGQYAPFAVGLAHDDDDDPTRFGGQSVYQQHLVYLAPAVSYQLFDGLSIGATVGFGQTAMGACVDMRSPNDLVAMTRVLGEATEGLEIPILSELTLPPPWFGGGVSPYDQVASFDMSLRDDFSPNYNLGILWEPLKWFSFGAVYQSEIKTQLTGTYTFNYTDTWRRMVNWFGKSPLLVITSGVLDLPIDPVPKQSGTVTSDTVTFPQRVQMGVKFKPIKYVTLLGDVAWSNWSQLKEDRFEFDQDIQLLRLVKLLGYTGGNRTLVLKRDFEDTWNWSVGLEIEPLDWLTLRFGYESRNTSVQDQLFDLMYALPDLDFYGAGVGLKLKNGVVLDLGFGYIVNKSFVVKNNGSTNLNSTVWTKPVYNPYAGLEVEQKTITYLGSINVTLPLSHVKKMMAMLNPFHKKDEEAPATDAGEQGANIQTAAFIPDSSKKPSEVLPPEQPSAAGRTYSLRLAEFDSRERAEMSLSFYEGDGLSPYLVQKGPVWAVYAGNYGTLEEAEAAKVRYDLPESAAEARPLTLPTPATRPFSLKLAEFDSRERAEWALSFYGSEGLTPYLIESQSGGGVNWAVYAGRYETLGSAEAAKERYGLSEAEPVMAPTAAPGRVSIPDLYALELASFSDQGRAEMALSFYESDGLAPYLVKVEADTGAQWKVYTGSFRTQAEAEKAKTDLDLQEATVQRSPR